MGQGGKVSKSSSLAISQSFERVRVMLGIRQPLDGPVFENLEDAPQRCISVMIDHNDRRLGISDAQIEPFKGLVYGER